MVKNSIIIESDLIKSLPCIAEKILVDFANGIDVTRDHLRTGSKASNSFFSRCLAGLTGSGARRQAEINANLTNSVEGSLVWLINMSQELAKSNYSIVRVNERVTELSESVAFLAEYSEDTRRQLNELAQTLDDRIERLADDISRVEFNQLVSRNIDQVFDKWGAGRLSNLSFAGRCYAAMEELRWGAFGDYCRSVNVLSSDGFLQQVVDRTIIQLAQDAQIGSMERVSTYDKWFKFPEHTAKTNDWREGLAYLADGFVVETAPMVVAITQDLSERLGAVPLLASAERIAEAVAEEVFLEAA